MHSILGRQRALLFVFFPFLLLLADGCMSTSSLAPTPSSQPPSPQSVWAAAWGNSPENALPSNANPGGSEQSFRMIFWPTLSGTQERLHFSNFFGTAPITIGSARLAVSPNGTAAVDPANDVAITFNGASSVTIPAGAIITSD